MLTSPKSTSDVRYRCAERLAAATALLSPCRLCAHRCGVDRSRKPAGLCRASADAYLYAHSIDCGEEPSFAPSHLLYLSGCDLRCVFCIAERASVDAHQGQPLTPELFRKLVEWGRARGARTLQWVGGDPTIHLPAILRVMAASEDLPPVVWKTAGHATVEALELLRGIVHAFVVDLKFGNVDCARQLCGDANYVAVVRRNLTMLDDWGQTLVVRHLLMPGHLECCLVPTVAWLRENLPHVPFRLCTGYLPRWRARRDPQLGRLCRHDEIEQAVRIVRDSGLRPPEGLTFDGSRVA